MPDTSIDLRSDTMTKPTAGMREAMAYAEVGDDMVGEDPTVNRLEARMADLFGKEAAVFACSGTQSNQMGVWAHCQRGDELLIERGGHLANYEAGGPAVLSGVTVRTIIGEAGRLDIEHLKGVPRRDDDHFAPSRLLSLENSTNGGGGRTYSLEQLHRVSEWARSERLKLHMDGARIFNACVARDYSPQEVGECVDTISVCFSKSLGCPLGSVLVGSEEAIARARHARKLFGGAMRQTGIVAAAALYALDHHIDRLSDDHKHARQFADGISQIDGIYVKPSEVETNLVFFEVNPSFGSAAVFSERLAQQGVKMYDLGPQRLRACMHLDIDAGQISKAVDIIKTLSVETDHAVDEVAASPYA